MRKTLLSISIFALSFMQIIAFAQTTTDTDRLSFPQVDWVSKNSSDEITIQNGNGIPLIIVISVASNANPNAAGIQIKNCGTSTRLKAGSIAICTTNDANRPVSFNSDSPNDPASGKYQVKQR